MEMRRAWSVLSVKAASGEGEERVIEGVASTPSTDRMGDIVEPRGASFELPLTLLWQHQHDKPVGTVEYARISDTEIKFRAKLAEVQEPGALRDRIDEAWQSIKAGLVRGVSIGFNPTEYSHIEGGGLRFSAWEWLELSLVTIPANAEATIQTIKSADAMLRAATGREEKPRIGTKPAASGVKPKAAKPPAPRRKTSMPKKMTLAEQIAAFRDTRAEKQARMAEIMDEAEGETLDEAAQEEFDTLEAEVKAIDDHVKRLRTLQSAEAEKAEPVEGGTAKKGIEARAPIAAKVKSPEPEPGIRIARYARCLGLAEKQRQSVMEIAKSLYGDRDPIIVKMVEKANVVAVNTTTDASLIGNEGGFADFVDFLRPKTIVGRFGAGSIPSLRRIPFRVPLVNQATGGTGYWVGEGKPKPLTKPTFGRTELAPLKVANIAVATMEALRDSSPAAEMLIRDDLAAAIIEAQDLAFIDPSNSGSAGVKPASITDSIAGTASTGNDADAVREDVRAAMAAFVASKNPLTAGVWVMSPSTALALAVMVNALGQPEFPSINMMGGTFFGLPVIVSEQVDGYVVLVNASDIWLADDGDVAVDMSDQASLQMLDNPTNDTVTPTATSMVSLWQTNSVGFRAERTINWARRRSSAVALITSVAWGEAASA